MRNVSELQQLTIDAIKAGHNTATRCATELDICGVTARARMRYLLSIGLLELDEPEGVGRSRATVYRWSGAPYRLGNVRRRKNRRTYESKKIQYPILDAVIAMPVR